LGESRIKRFSKLPRVWALRSEALDVAAPNRSIKLEVVHFLWNPLLGVQE